MKRISSLPKKKAQLELLKTNLISLDEKVAIRTAKPILINDIKGIGTFYSQKLNKGGIRTVDDLLYKCKSEIKIWDMATRLGISIRKLQKWVELAKMVS